ncbi:MAG: GlsB/YeaQ/YmgE family stress response membrane protein [Candidatus Pacebacteria bacterium]|jgi:uncharacterized membrane protein YeaQ/YmgE (transglycosylase-associated protein family)|nr:GlsB/YeaQ/YmgE family stress response membrane protein [Candidatus Paceibacterota bacterium]
MVTILWVVFGGLIGWIEDLSMNKENQNAVVDVVFGVIGAVLGVWIMSLFGQNGFVSFDWYSLLAALFGSILLVWVVSAIRK